MLRYNYLKASNDVSLQCRYYGKYMEGGLRGFILECCDGMDLYEFYKGIKGRGKSFSVNMVKATIKYAFGSLCQLRRCPFTWFRHILSGLVELNRIPLIHRDIK